MPVNRNALIRYKTIDKCLQNRYRKWTLEDLINACSDALYEYEGIKKGVSRRTIQSDLQIMRSDKLGYNAPIVVTEKKYYYYEDPDYTITNIPITPNDLEKLEEVVEILKQFKGFSHFKELTDIIQKLEDKVYYEKTKSHPIIDFEKNENLKGLDFLDMIYRAIQQKKVLEVEYQSFTARQSNTFLLHAYLLKEYRNRWFILGKKDNEEHLITLALDRICNIGMAPHIKYVESDGLTPSEYYKNIIGITVNRNQHPVKVRLFANNATAPYLITKPLHHSQQVVSVSDDGVEITINVILNFELEREILSYGEGIKVLEPIQLLQHIERRLEEAIGQYI